MAQTEWTPELETGLSDIDEQHQQMVSYINELHKVSHSGNPMLIAQTLFDLISCAMSHFAYEEELLEAVGYNLLEVRRNSHTNFTNRLLDFQNRLMSGESAADELLDQLDSWVSRHIRINDQGYVETVRQSGLYKQNDNGQWQRIGSDTPPQEESVFDAEIEITASDPVSPAETNVQTQQDKQQQTESENKPARSWAGTY